MGIIQHDEDSVGALWQDVAKQFKIHDHKKNHGDGAHILGGVHPDSVEVVKDGIIEILQEGNKSRAELVKSRWMVSETKGIMSFMQIFEISFVPAHPPMEFQEEACF